VERAEHWISYRRTKGVSPDSVSFSTVIHACVMAQEPRRAEQWLEEMCKERSISQEQSGAFCYNSVIQAWVKVGKSAQAAKWLTASIEKGVEASASCFAGVVGTFMKAGELEQAEYWLATMESRGVPAPPSGAGCHEAVANAWAQRGNATKAAALRKMGVEAAKKVPAWTGGSSSNGGARRNGNVVRSGAGAGAGASAPWRRGGH